MLMSYTRRVNQKYQLLLFFQFQFLRSENELLSSKSCCVTKVSVPFDIYIKSRWANTGLNALQGILKVFLLDVSHL